MRRHHTIAAMLLLMLAGGLWQTASSQTTPLKPRPDAFPPKQEITDACKAVTMAYSVEEMTSWNRYPTYQTYLDMMRQWAADYPDLCTVDTIGTSVQGRLILAARITGPTDSIDTSPTGKTRRPEFFYSSTIHGDEVTGYVMMLRLIDTLLASYGTSQRLTELVNSTAIYINPLANPDGTYHHGDSTVRRASRYNANGVDLNRNYPDPFGSVKAALETENEAMIDYLSNHSFLLSANLHGGAEVMNYPWDSFTSFQNPHPQRDWWQEVCRRFVDTSRIYGPDHFSDVVSSGYVNGGDWYVIRGGRQDYVNYYHNCLELTMEISSVKTISSELLPEYWHFLAPSFINYIDEIHNLPESVGISELRTPNSELTVYPNPATDRIVVENLPEGTPLTLYDAYGRVVATGVGTLDVSNLPKGIYLLSAHGFGAKVVKN